MSEPKKPSGSANRKARRERDTQERAAAIAARETGAGLLGPPEPCRDMGKAHLWTLENLVREVADTYNDPSLSPAERRRQVAELSRAIGMLQTKADLERRIEALEAKLNAALDEVAQKRAELEQEARRRLQ